MVRSLSLQRKIALALVLIYAAVFLFVLLLTPDAVFLIARERQVRDTMSFNRQVAMRMESRFSEITRFSNMAASDNELKELLEIASEKPDESIAARLRLCMSELITRDGISTYQVLGMYLCLENGLETSTVGLNPVIAGHIRQNILPLYAESGQERMFTEPFRLPAGHDLALWANEFSKGFGYVRPYSLNGIRGTLVIVASYDSIAYITSSLTGASTDYVLLSASGKRIEPAEDRGLIDAEKVLAGYEYGDSYEEGFRIDDGGVYAVRHVYDGNWHLVTYLSRDEVIARNEPQAYVIIFSFAIFGVVSILAVVLITNVFVRPLKDVSSQMEAIANGDFNARVDIRSNDEIGQVSQSFNTMAGRLETTMEEILEREKMEHQMRYGLLIAQVDPHFIYNTMNTITYLAQKGRNEDVIIVNRAMIDILRDRLRIDINDVYDTVIQEIHVVEQYLTIQQYRFQGVFKQQIRVDPKAENIPILKNVIQPLVENALGHGILETKDENGEPLGGRISIDADLEGKEVVIRVADNGNGMTEETLEAVLHSPDAPERGTKIGLRNIRERLTYIYGDKASFEITSRPGFGTTVTMRLPVPE